MSTSPPTGMIRLGTPLPVSVYLAELWRRRDYMIEVPLSQVRAQHLNTVLGNLWHLINPALQMAVYYLVFGVILDVSRGVDNFIAFLALGVLPFRWFVNSVQNGAGSISGNIGVIRAIRFPRAVLPISTFIEGLIGFLPVLPVMLGVAVVTGEPISWKWLVVLPVLASLGLCSLGLTFITARLTSGLSDVKQMLPFIFRLQFYLSGILYSVDAWVENETARTAFAANPVYSAITVLRWAVLEQPVRAEHVISLVVWPIVVLPVGFEFFRRAEEDYGRG